MDPISTISAGAKSVKQLTNAAKELDGSIKELNDFMNQPLHDQAHMRAEKLRRERMAPYNREKRAYVRLLEKKKAEAEREQMKNDVNKTFGKGSWEELQGIVRQLEKEEAIEKKELDKDANKLFELKLACFAAAAVITFFLSKAGLL